MKYYELNIKRNSTGWTTLYFKSVNEAKFLDYGTKYYAGKGKIYNWKEWNAEAIEPAIKAGFIKIYKEL